MKITKFGHCCLLIEENGVRILTDPGTYSTQQSEVKYIDFVGANPNSTDKKLIRIDDAKSSWGSKLIEYPIFVWQNKNKFRNIVLRLLLSFYR